MIKENIRYAWSTVVECPIRRAAVSPTPEEGVDHRLRG